MACRQKGPRLLLSDVQLLILLSVPNIGLPLCHMSNQSAKSPDEYTRSVMLETPLCHLCDHKIFCACRICPSPEVVGLLIQSSPCLRLHQKSPLFRLTANTLNTVENKCLLLRLCVSFENKIIPMHSRAGDRCLLSPEILPNTWSNVTSTQKVS